MTSAGDPGADPGRARGLLEEGEVLDGRLRIERLLGRGGMGEVWAATQLSVGREVAVKVLLARAAEDPSLAARFEREARAASRLTSPHTVTVHDFGRDEKGRLYLVLERVHGPSLARLLEDSGPLSVPRAVEIARGILASLAEAHALGMVHRDVKPQNVLVSTAPTGEEIARLTDFGIAKTLAGDLDDDGVRTSTGVLLGTPRYMSPEQAAGEARIDARSDLYSVAVVLYEMLAGGPLFPDAASARLVLASHVHVAPPALDLRDPRLASRPRLTALVHAALSKVPEDRPRDAIAFRNALVEAMAPGPSPDSPRDLASLGSDTLASRADLAPVPPEPLAEPSPPPPRPRRRLVLALALGGLGLALGLLLLDSAGPPPDAGEIRPPSDEVRPARAPTAPIPEPTPSPPPEAVTVPEPTFEESAAAANPTPPEGSAPEIVPGAASETPPSSPPRDPRPAARRPRVGTVPPAPPRGRAGPGDGPAPPDDPAPLEGRKLEVPYL